MLQSMGLQRAGHNLAIENNNGSNIESQLSYRRSSLWHAGSILIVACELQFVAHMGSRALAQQLQCVGSVVVAYGLSCPVARGIFPHSPVSKESACNAVDLGSIPGSGRSPGEGNGNPLQYSCLENPMDRGVWQATVHGVTKSRARLCNCTSTFHFHALEKEMATHSSILVWKIPWTEEPGRLQSTGSQRVRHS